MSVIPLRKRALLSPDDQNVLFDYYQTLHNLRVEYDIDHDDTVRYDIMACKQIITTILEKAYSYSEQKLVNAWLEVHTLAMFLDVLVLGEDADDLVDDTRDAIDALFEQMFLTSNNRDALRKVVCEYRRLRHKELELKDLDTDEISVTT